ncbi:glycosyltransferase, partial [Faecalibacterium sp. CLA-AA-H254]|uniref:glycosyltransferase n=1 Tax=Faecalibacterium hominis (ex Afrizal et al. 2022) TaxID=2881265 RepID=UPI001D0EB531|nr:glycosyltransferase [Faecalibacterium hominis (ex Afrizal et al. 2022)]
MIRIAYVINYIVKNGPSSVVLNLINNLDRSEYDTSLITLFEGNDAEVVSALRSNGVTIYECKTLSRMKCLLGQSKEFPDVVEKGYFDILHTHGIIPDILSSRLHTTAKRIATIHNNMYEDYLDTYGYAKSRIFIALHLAALKKLDECVCCSKSVYDVMKQHLPNVLFIRNGIEPTHAHS